MTCRHLKNLQRQNKFYINSEQSYADRFRDGFSQCAKEVAKFLYGQQNARAGEHIVVHLNECMRRLDNLTNAANANNNNNNNSIANNNNYIPNDSLQLDLNHSQQQSFVMPTPHHNNHHHLQNIRQPIAIPLVRKSPIPPQNYLALPSQPQKLVLSANMLDRRSIDNDSPMLTRPISRDSLSSPPSASSSPGNMNMKEEPVWRPW